MNTLCISKSWLRQKSQELGIKDSAIEIIVHEYINQQGNDNFPTDDYIKQQFVPKSQIVDDKDYYDNLMKIYDSMGGETIYNTEEEAIVAQNKALKVFDEDSVTLMPTNDGKYIVRIAEPINKNYEKELQDILAKAPRDSQGRLLAPNGKPSNLTERQYAQVRTKEFKDWFGDWERANTFNIDTIDTSKVDIEEHDKPWKNDPTKSNKTLRIYLKGQHEKGYFELVKDHEFGMFSVHFKTTKAGAKYNSPTATESTKEDRKILFTELIKAIPEGGMVSTWGSLSEDGVRGIDNVGRGMTKVGEREVTLKSDGSTIKIPIYQKGKGVSKVIDKNGEPLVVYHNDRILYTNFSNKLNKDNTDRIYFSPFRNKWKNFSGNEEHIVFLNIKNPYYGNIEENNLKSFDNNDGLILELDNIIEEYIIPNPNQVKSATNNTGAFSTKDDNINNNQIDFFEDNTDVRKKPQIKEDIEKGKDYTIDKLIELFNKYSIDKEQQELAKKVFAVAKKLNFKVQFLVDNLGWNIAGQQDYNVLKIARITTLEQNKNKLADVLLHETIHGVTTYAINAYKNGELKDKKLIEAVEELQNVYDSILDNKSIKDEYGLTNVKELVAELANPSFRDKLKKISIWEKLKNAIKKIFFFFSESNVSAHTVLSDALDKFLDNYDVNLWNSYNITPDTKIDDFNFDIINNQQKQSQTKFSTSESSSYPERTKENADWSDITLDFTESDKGSGGRNELTKKVAGKKYIHFKLHSEGDNSYDADEILDAIKQAGLPTKNIKLNIAGSEIGKLKENQEVYNEEIERILNDLLTLGVTISEIRTGGQTGIDEAGIIAAQRLGIPNEVHTTSDYKFRDKSGEDISDDEQAFKARFQQQPQTQLHTIKESVGYKRMNVVLQDLINKIDESGIKSAKAARNLYDWTIQANNAILDAINKGEREDELIDLDNFLDTLNRIASYTPKELGEKAIKAIKELSKDFGIQQQTQSQTQQPQGEKVSDKNTYKGKKKDEKPTIEFANDTQKETYDNFVEKQRELGTIIDFNPTNHTYLLEGIMADFSVTEYKTFALTGKRPKKETSFWFEVSGRLGTSHDEMLRDFFGKGLQDSYTNVSPKQVEEFRIQAQKFKEELQNEFGRDAIFITDEDLLRVAGTINNDGKNFLVAGTMDMIVIDNKGVLHIVDFKTKRANLSEDFEEKTVKGYNRQVNLYKHLLANTLGTDTKIGTTRIAQFNVKYTADNNNRYTYEKNQIKYKGKPIQYYSSMKDSKKDPIYEVGKFYDTIEFEEDLSEELFDKILPAKTKIQLRQEANKYHEKYGNTYDDSFDDWAENDDSSEKNTRKNKNTRKANLGQQINEKQSEIEKLTKQLEELNKKFDKLLGERKKDDKKNDKNDSKDKKKKTDFEVSHPLIKSQTFTRDSAKKDVKTLYIFTDNTNRDSGSEVIPDDSWYAQKYGKGLHYPTRTTAVVRGLDNARPVSTQRYYKKGEDYKKNRWFDKDIEEFKKVVDAEFEDIFEAWRSGNYDRIVIPDGDGFFNAGISDISKDRVPEIEAYLESKIQELYKVLDESIEEKKEAKRKEIQEKLKYKRIELQQVQQKLNEFVDDFYHLELQEEKGDYTAQYILSMDKFLTGQLTDDVQAQNTIINDNLKKRKLQELTLCMPLSSLLTLDTTYVNYNLLYTLDELLKNKSLFPIGPSKQIELSDDLKLIAEGMKKQNKEFPYDIKTGILQIPQFTVGYTHAEIVKRSQRNKLLNNDLISQSQLRMLAKATIYKVSEIITKIHNNLNGYTYYFGRTEGDPNVDKDFTQMSRIEIIQTIGLDRLFDQVKNGREAVFNTNYLSGDAPLDLYDKIDLITKNWDAFIDLGYDTLINLEEIALDNNNSTTSLKSDIDDLFEDNDESVIQELFGSSIEHWQVGFRQVSAINSMSKQLKIVLDSFYQVDENGDIITDDLGIGIGKHLNAQEAAAKILYYTQGARSIEDMIKLLKDQLDTEPWLYQLMPYIEDQYDREGNLISKADETFRSQFYSNFKKYFQKYAITFKKGNKIQTKIINESSYTDSLMDISKALENSATLGKFNLKTKENKLNEEALEELKKLSNTIDNFASTASNVRGAIDDNTNFNLDKFHDTLHQIYNLLNIDTPNNETFYKIFSIKNNINTLNKKLKYLISNGIEQNKDKINDGSKAITSIKDYKDIADIVGKYMGLEMESVTYEAGKMYYSYVLPSYLGRLISKLKGENLSAEEYADVLEKEYLQYPQFRRDKRIRCYWLERLKASKEVRNMFQHIVSLHYLGVEYTNKTPVEYIASMMRAYFYDDNKNWAYYRVPTLSNKPSEEYIRFIRIHNGYESTIIEKLYDTFSYELDRIQAVRERRNKLFEDRKIKNFDSFIKKDKDGNIKIKKGNGEKFVFLDWVQPYLDGSFKNTKEYRLTKKQAENNEAENNEDAKKLLEKMQQFSDLLNKKLDDKMSNENADNAKLLELFKAIAKVSIEQKYQEARQYWEKEGFLTRKPVEKNGKKTETIEIFGFGKGSNQELTQEDLREFFFNDMFAAINILQLTVGDTAYYKDTEDLQKRLAQIHAPGMQANVMATYVQDGQTYRYSDGFERTMYISDDIIKSELIPNLNTAMNNILSEYDKNSKQYTILKNQFKFILKTAKEINVADAQGFSCLTSHRKKLALFGQWTDRMEEAYLQLTDPEYAGEDASLNDILDVLLQPIKPFVYTQIPKNGHNENLPKLKVGVQNKNSEYVIALVGAILKKGNQPNKLRAIYQFMEDSQKDGKGIDTIQFESTVKAGLTGVINLNGNMTEEEVYNVLQNHLYDKEGNYDIDYVHEIPFEDYIIQQNVPSHFRDHEQAHGSQNRILAVADLQDTDENGNNNYITIDGKTVTVKEAKENYFNAIADNIRLSVNQVIKRFNLNSVDKRQRNIALSRILKDAILKDSRFGADLYWACDTNEYGEFNIPLSDPIHSTRIQQLLNSIIKNAINKQEIAGGPVVQATSWGLSDDLHIRFKAYNNQILLTEEEFETENYPTDYDTGNYFPKGNYTSYEDYIKDNQDCVAYFECYVPIQDQNIALDFTRKDAEGNEYIDVEAMKEANPKLLEMISYRIPTESKYSMVPIKVKGFINNMSGELIMMPKEITWLSGSDFDVDKQYIMRYQLERVEHKDGTVTYKMPKSGKAYNDNLIISTQLAILESEHTTRQLFTPGNFEEPKRLGYTIEYVQSKIREAKELGEDYNIQELYNKAATMDNDKLKDVVKTRSNLIYNNVQSQFHKQNMVAGQLIGIFAQANVSHAFLGLVDNTALLLGNSGIEFTIDNTYVGGEYQIDNIYSNDGITYQSSILASLLAASVDAVKDPILNLANINLDTANIVTSMVRMGFSLEQIVLLLNQPIVQQLVRDLGIENANNKNEGKTYHKDLSRIIDETIASLELSKEELKDLQEIKITSEALINNLDGSDDITSYMAVRIISNILNISSSFSNIQHMTRYNSISSAVGPTATDTMLNRIKDEIFKNDELLNLNIIEACGVPIIKESGEEVYNPILYWFREGANTLERAILGENLIQADEDFFTSLKRVGNACGFKKGLPDDVARKFADFYMSYYVNTNPTGTVFDLSKERREFMIKDFPLYFQEIKSKYAENPFIQAIILKTASTEEYPFLQLKTRGLGSEDIEDLKQGWATLFLNGGEDADLAIALVEYNFFRGGFGFSPKTFTNLIPNVIKYNLPNYLNTLNTKRSSMNSENPESKPWTQYRMLVQFLLHNPEIIRDKYYNMNLYNPQVQENGNIIIDVIPDFSKSKSKYPPKIIGEFLPTGWIIRTPIIIIDGKAYYVNKQSAEGVTDNVQITITPTDFLGGNGQGIEIDVNKMLIKSIYNQPKVKNNNTAENNRVLNEEEIKILMANLFENEEFSPMVNAPSKGRNVAAPVIDQINKALSDKDIKYNIHQSNKNRNTVRQVMDIIKDALKNKEDIKEVLNSTNKTLDDLNLCS